MKYEIENNDWLSFLQESQSIKQKVIEKRKSLQSSDYSKLYSGPSPDLSVYPIDIQAEMLKDEIAKHEKKVEAFYECANWDNEYDERRIQLYEYSSLLCLQLSHSVSELKKTIEELKNQSKNTSENSVKNRNIYELGFGSFAFLCMFIYLIFNYLYDSNSYYSERGAPFHKIESALKALKTVVLEKKKVNNEDNEQWIAKPEIKPKISAPEEYINAVQMDSIQNRIDAFELKKMDNDSLN